MKIETSIEIERSPEDVWPWVTETEKMKQWQKGLLEVTPLNDVEGVGARARLKIKEGHRVCEYEDEVTVWEPPERLAVRLWGGPLPEGMEMEISYELEDLGGRTRIHTSCGCEVKGFFMKLFSPLFKLFAGMQQRSFFKRLKILVEAA